MKDIPLSEITLRKYEKPVGLERRELVQVILHLRQKLREGNLIRYKENTSRSKIKKLKSMRKFKNLTLVLKKTFLVSNIFNS